MRRIVCFFLFFFWALRPSIGLQCFAHDLSLLKIQSEMDMNGHMPHQDHQTLPGSPSHPPRASLISSPVHIPPAPPCSHTSSPDRFRVSALAPRDPP